MTRLSLKQLLFAIAVGSLFAALQARAPAPDHSQAQPVSAACAVQSTNRC